MHLLNVDGVLNILDIVITANMVLVGEYDVIADVNEDGEHPQKFVI